MSLRRMTWTRKAWIQKPRCYSTTSYPAGRFPGLYLLPGSPMRSTTLLWIRAPSGIFRVRLPRIFQNPAWEGCSAS